MVPTVDSTGIISKEQRKLSQEGRGLAGCLWFQKAPQGQSPKETDVSARWWEGSPTPKDVRWRVGRHGTLGSLEVVAEVGGSGVQMLIRDFRVCGRWAEAVRLSVNQTGLGRPGAYWSETVRHSTRVGPRCPAFLALRCSGRRCHCPRKGVISGEGVLQPRPTPWGSAQGSKAFHEAGSAWSISTQGSLCPFTYWPQRHPESNGPRDLFRGPPVLRAPALCTSASSSQGQASLADNSVCTRPPGSLPSRPFPAGPLASPQGCAPPGWPG